jgi:hypothetical protein
MEKVMGIGGLFFRSRDPQSRADWYATHLGVTPVPANYDDSPWRQQRNGASANPSGFSDWGTGSCEWVQIVDAGCRVVSSFVSEAGHHDGV